MSKDLTKRASPTKPEPKPEPKPERQQSTGAASRLKRELMTDALGRMFGEDGEKPDLTGTPRVILALANHGRNPGWDRAKALQRQLFAAAAAQGPGTNCVGTSAERANGLEMKFAFYGPDNAAGVRGCRITARWISDPGDMAAVIDRAECSCGCFVNIRSVLAQAVREAGDRQVIIVGDAFHDNQDGLDEAAISANQLRRAGTRVFLIQLGGNPDTARKLQYLARVSGGTYFRFDPRTRTSSSPRCSRPCRPTQRAARKP